MLYAALTVWAVITVLLWARVIETRPTDSRGKPVPLWVGILVSLAWPVIGVVAAIVLALERK